MQDVVATDAATTRSSTPPPPPPTPSWSPEGGTVPATWTPYSFPTPGGSQAPWPANSGAPGTGTPPPQSQRDEDEERRRGIPPWSPLYGAGAGAADIIGGQPYTPYASGAPVVQGTPQVGSVPNISGSPSPFTNAPAPAGHLAQAPASAPGFQSPGTYYPPQAGQQVPPQYPQYPPEHGGRPEDHPQHQHAHHEHHAQHAHHLHHAAAGATKVAGGSAIKTIVIVVTTIVVVGAGGIAAAAYFLTRPQPLISITSNFKQSNALAGASGTILHIKGQKFSSNSAITFLLDGNPAPGNPTAHSDASGNFSADVQITSAWTVGTHVLTARDASNNSTKNSVSVTVVQPGQANTPGPNGAPPDDATFKISTSLVGQFTTISRSYSTTEDLSVSGHPDPAGGSVCTPTDDGKVHFHNYSTVNNGTPYDENVAFSCSGTYKGGKVTYTETILSDVITFTNSSPTVTCTLDGPQPFREITGTYTSNGEFSGTFSDPGIPQTHFSCPSGNGTYFFYYSITGTWTGTVSGLQG